MVKRFLLYCAVVLFFFACSSKKNQIVSDKNITLKSDNNISNDNNNTKNDNNNTKKNDKKEFETTFLQDMKEMQEDMAELYIRENKSFFPKDF